MKSPREARVIVHINRRTGDDGVVRIWTITANTDSESWNVSIAKYLQFIKQLMYPTGPHFLFIPRPHKYSS